MSKKWQSQEAKARFAEVVRLAAEEGPQLITHRGVEAAVVLSFEEYQRLKDAIPSFKEFLLSGPKLDDETVAFINGRNPDPGRDIDL